MQKHSEFKISEELIEISFDEKSSRAAKWFYTS